MSATTYRGRSVVTRRLTWEQYCDWRNALLLNRYSTFAELRALYLRIKGGAQYGRCSGVQS
jgi:hypothetical protein